MARNEADRLGGWVVVAALVTCGLVFAAAPILGLWWSSRPFPGFVVEQTLLIADQGGRGWSPSLAGQRDLQRVVQVGPDLVNRPKDLDASLNKLSWGETTVVRTLATDGTIRIHPLVEMGRFPLRDQLRLFWLPYGVGLVYFALGLLVYRVRGGTPPARAFSFFCAAAAIATGLLFDLITTHVGSDLWTVSMALGGGALVSLALLFPEEPRAIGRHPWIRLLPYAPSAVLVVWGLRVVRDASVPWAYVAAWRGSYIYTALGIITLVAVMWYRQRMAAQAVARQQARVILWGTVFSFAPLVVWALAPLFGRVIPFQTTLFVPFLLIFPLSIALAILRYRLWDIDWIINRTLVYSALTVILAGIYYGSVVGLQALFRTATGQTSPLVVAVSTLGIMVLFNPLRRWVQDVVDRRFYRKKYDAAQTLSTFGETLRQEVDLSRLVGRLEEVIQTSLEPDQIRCWLLGPSAYSLLTNGQEPDATANGSVDPGDPIVEYLRGAAGVVSLSRIEAGWPVLQQFRLAGVELLVPLMGQSELVGWLGLGPRRSGQDYSLDDRALLRNLAVQASPAVRVAQFVRRQQAEALERARLEHELRFARVIQQALLPKATPQVPGWHFDVHWQPARAVGGDLYDFLPLPDGRLFITIADVADKGIPAALVMATIRSILRGTARRLLSPAEALAQTNNILHPELPPGMFVTCLYIFLDLPSGRLRWANAGHNWPYRRLDGRVSELEATGMALGVLPDIRYDEYETVIEPGESLLLYSDGLVEAHNAQGEMLGYPRLQSMVAQLGADGSSPISALLRRLADFTGPGWEQEDDVTLLTIERLGTGREDHVS